MFRWQCFTSAWHTAQKKYYQKLEEIEEEENKTDDEMGGGIANRTSTFFGFGRGDASASPSKQNQASNLQRPDDPPDIPTAVQGLALNEFERKAEGEEWAKHKVVSSRTHDSAFFKREADCNLEQPLRPDWSLPKDLRARLKRQALATATELGAQSKAAAYASRGLSLEQMMLAWFDGSDRSDPASQRPAAEPPERAVGAAVPRQQGPQPGDAATRGFFADPTDVGAGGAPGRRNMCAGLEPLRYSSFLSRSVLTLNVTKLPIWRSAALRRCVRPTTLRSG